ncbi:MAG: hypothetical protein ACR2LM_14535 [Pyrinomonadaceae bacterium]
MRRSIFKLGVGVFIFLVSVSAVAFWFAYRTPATETLGLPPCAGPPGYEMTSVPCSEPDLSVFSNLPVAEYCDVVRDSARHSDQIVRVRGKYFFNMENSALYDPACRNEDSWTWVDYEPYSNFEDARRSAGLRRAVEAEVVFLGKWSGPSAEGYGHLNGYRYKLSVFKVETMKAKVSDAR